MLDKSNKRWKDLVTGKFPLKTENLGLQMYLKRTTTKLGANSSPADIDKAVVEIHGFFLKFERVLQNELALLSK
jgi:hypothetical protein